MKTYRVWSKDGTVIAEVKGFVLDWVTDAGLVVIRDGERTVLAVFTIANIAGAAELE